MTMRDSIASAQISGPIPRSDGAARFEYQFAADDPTFLGHFPTRPLLPGAFQLEMARRATEAVLNCSLSLREISKAKFLRPILPGDRVGLELTWSEKDDGIRAVARFSVETQPASHVHLLLCRLA